jgi:hypothetical protein
MEGVIAMTTLRGLFMRYYEVRESMRAPKTSMPTPEALKMDFAGEQSNTVKCKKQSRDKIELDWAFVCDVENYLARIAWHDSLLIKGRVTAHDEDQKSWRILIKEMDKDGRPFPKRYKNKGNLSKFFGEVIKPNAEAYFRDRGYLR